MARGSHLLCRVFRILIVAAAGAAAVALLACRHNDDIIVGAGSHGGTRLTAPTELCRMRTSGSSCRDVADVEALLARGHLEIIDSSAPPAGVQGARVLTLRTAGGDPVVFRAKWRADSTTTSRNSPRLELGAYAVQKLFLAPGEYVVPPTAPHCFPIAEYRARVDAKARASFRGVPCVYGILSYWLEDVQSLGGATRAGWFHGADQHAFDPALFEQNDAYRDSIASVNLLTYVSADADSHATNFVITRDASAPAVYSVDNSLSLGMAKNPRLEPRHDWSRIRVPSLPRAAIDRLRTAGDRLPSLGAIAVLEVDDGQLVEMSPAPTSAAPSATGTTWAGGRLTVGLTPSEIDGVRRRIAVLLQRLDSGQLRSY